MPHFVPDIPDITKIYNFMTQLRPLVLNKNDFEAWSYIERVAVQTLQDAALSGDPNAQSWVSTNRAFFKNNDAVSRTITIDGRDYTLAAMRTYSCNPLESNFFLTKAIENNFNFSGSTFSAWLAEPGVSQEFTS